MLEITESLLRLRDIGPGPKLLFVLLDNLSKGGGVVLDHRYYRLRADAVGPANCISFALFALHIQPSSFPAPSFC